jgi:hypothetical protein
MNPEKSSLYTAKRPSGLCVDADLSLKEAIGHLRDDNRTTNWLLMKIDALSNSLLLHSTGSNGYDELLLSLSSEEVLFGALRCTVRGQVRFLHLYCVGEGVSALRKGKASLNKTAAFTVVDAQAELTIQGSCSVEELRAEVATRLRCLPEEVLLT